MIFHHLVRVWIPKFDQWDRRSFAGEVASNLVHYLERGPDHLHHLMDLSDWDLDRLRTGEQWRPYRKPQIDVRALLTTREGLAIEWAPRGWWDQPTQAQKHSCDFLRFNTAKEIGDGHPNNRLFYLKDFGVLMTLGRAPKPEEAELIHATADYIRSLMDSLRVSFDIRIIDNLEVTYGPSVRHLDRAVIGAAIFNVEERLAQQRKTELDAWEKDHLQPFGLDLRVVCDAFALAERSAAKAARELTKTATKPVTATTARKWLDALERRLGRFEKKAESPSAKVIPLRRQD